MENWAACEHGRPCALKTGTRPGPTYGKNFFICRSQPQDQCRFVKGTRLPAMTCPQHGKIVSVRIPKDVKSRMLRYRCADSPSSWCGVARWEGQDKENVSPAPSPKKSTAKNSRVSGFLLDLSEERDSDESGSEGEGEGGGGGGGAGVDGGDEEVGGNCEGGTGKTEQVVIVSSDESEGEKSVCVLESSRDKTEEREEERERGEEENDVASVEADLTGGSLSSEREETVEDQSGWRSVCSEIESEEEEETGEETGEEEEETEEEEEEEQGEHMREGISEGEDIEVEDVPRESSCGEDQMVVGVSESVREQGRGSCTEEEKRENEEEEEERKKREDGTGLSGDSMSPMSVRNIGHRKEEEEEEEGEGEGEGEEEEEEGEKEEEEEEGEGVEEVEDDKEETDGVVVKEPQFKLGSQYRTLSRQLEQMEHLIQTMADKLPDGGQLLKTRRQMILDRISRLKRAPPPPASLQSSATAASAKIFRKEVNLQTRMLTSGVVEQLHCSLESCPGVDTLAPQPERLSVPLFRHQLRALAWLLWRERQLPSGGILADEMGLGKTLSIISLILENPSDLTHQKDGLVTSRATLVVCAPTLIHQWKSEIDTKVKPRTLSVVIYHGPRRTRDPHDLARHDVVITTYDTVGVEGGTALSEDTGSAHKRRTAASTTLFQVFWHRIVLDEAHKIRNPKTAMSLGVTGLAKVHRWAVTGTPVQNRLTDLFSLIRFLELAPFDDMRVWKESIERRSIVGMQRLRTMIGVLVLRRTKEDISSAHKLTEKYIITHKVNLEADEQHLYDALFAEARNVFVKFLAEQQQGESTEPNSPPTPPPPPPSLPPLVLRWLHRILQPMVGGQARHGAMLGLLMRLRQCCCHPHLMVAGVQSTDVEQGLEEALQSLSLSPTVQPLHQVELPPVFQEQTLSTKTSAVLREVRRIVSMDPPEKCIIVSQWIKLLDIIQFHLTAADISFTRIDSRVPPQKRSENMASFNSACRSPSVMLLSMMAGGEGLNLIGGNHVFMLDLHWNPAAEQQASDRAHRLGQRRDVHVHRFVCQSTVEERIQLLQEKKLELSRAVLSGASRAKQGSRLTLEDLKLLFQVQ